MAWRAARSLLVLHQQLQAGAPRARPPATPDSAWGLIGDALHDPESDHSPHDFPGWGNDIVTAADFPNAPALGLDAFRVLDDIRRSRDPRLKYAISNDQICSSYATSSRAAWTWGPYNPNSPNRDRHYTHGHLSVVGDARADGQQPWATIGGDMLLSDPVPGSGSSGTGGKDRTVAQILGDLANLRAVFIGEKTPAQAGYAAGTPLAQLLALAAAGPAAPVDVAAFAGVLAPLLSERLDVELDAAAVLGVLESPEGQAALVQASTVGANAAEDS
jgi:hypothetical protein